MLFIESTFKCDNVCGSNLFDNKKWYRGGGEKNLVMAFQMSPCCCFYESSLRRLLRRFSLIFHPEGHTSDDSTAANKHKNTDEILIIFLFARLFRIIPSSCSTTTATRRWCPCGCVAVWRSGAPRDTPDGDHVEERPEGAPSVRTAPSTGSEITRCWKLYVSNSSIKFGCFVCVKPGADFLRMIWSRLSPSSKVCFRIEQNCDGSRLWGHVCPFMCRNVDHKWTRAVWSSSSRYTPQKYLFFFHLLSNLIVEKFLPQKPQFLDYIYRLFPVLFTVNLNSFALFFKKKKLPNLSCSDETRVPTKERGAV